MVLGTILVVLGALLLLQTAGVITYNFWGIFWPAVLIIIGLKFITKRGGHALWCCGRKDGEKKEGQ
jgi:predicted membrane protein